MPYSRLDDRYGPPPPEEIGNNTNGRTAKAATRTRKIIIGLVSIPLFIAAVVYGPGLLALLFYISMLDRPQPELPTVDGPEATDIANKTSGCIITYGDTFGEWFGQRKIPYELVATEIASKREFEITPRVDQVATTPWCSGDRCWVRFFDGPDGDGLIAFFESNDFDFHKPAQPKKFALMVMKIGDTEPREIFSRPGSATWVESLRLSPRGGQIAFIAMDQTSRLRTH